MPDRTIRIVLAGSSTGAVRAIAQTGAAAEVTQGKLDRMHTAGQKMGSVGRTMTQLALPMVALGGYAVKTAATFQDSMTLLRTQVGVGTSEVTKMSTAIQGLTPKVGEGPRALAAALYPIESVGLRGSAALGALKAAAMGAQVSGASLTDTANALAGALKVSLPDVHNASDAMSILNQTTAQGKMHLQDLVDALGTGVTQTAQQAGLGLRDVGTALAAMSRATVPPQVEATRLQRTLMLFESPKGLALKQFQALGMGQYQLADDLRKPKGLITALLDLRRHLSGLTKDQQNTALQNMFGGTKGSANVMGLLNQLPAMQQIGGQLQGANASQLQRAFKIRSQDMSYKWGQFKANSEAAMIGLGDAIMPIAVVWLPKLTKVITEVAGWFKGLSPQLKKVLLWATAFLAIGGPILIFTGRLVSAVSSIASAFKVLGGPAGRLATTLFPGLETQTGLLRKGLFGILGPLALVTAGFIALYPNLKRGIHNLVENVKSPKRAVRQDLHSMVSGQQMGTGLGYTPGLMGQGQGGLSGLLQGLPLVGGLFHHTGGPIRHLSDGGLLGGYGGGDRVPAMLENGEFVLKKETAQAIGGGALNSINQTGSLAGAGGHSGGPGTLYVTMPVSLRISNGRVLAEEVVHFAAQKSAMSGRFVSG